MSDRHWIDADRATEREGLLQRQVDSLEKENEHWKGTVEAQMELGEAAQARIESLETENERLRAAIRDAAECADSDIQDMLLEALEHQGGEVK